MSLVDLGDERQRYLWERTFTGNEFATTEFWAYIFKEEIFVGRDFSIAPDSPPTEALSDRRRVDLVVKKWQPGIEGEKGKFAALLFFEAKKHNATQTEIETLERQAFTASFAWLVENREEQAYSMTVIGDAARLWYTTDKSEYPYPLVPAGPELADRDSYIKAASSSAYELRKGFDIILQHPHGLPESMILKSNATPPQQVAERAEGVDYDMSYDPAEIFNYGASDDQYGTAPDADYGASYDQHGAAGGADYGTSFRSQADISMDNASFAAAANEYDPAPIASSSTRKVPSLPNDAEYVEVKLRVEADTHFYQYESRGKWREAKESDWERRTVRYNKEVRECFVNIRKAGQHFWTWTLDPTRVPRISSSKLKGKGRT